MNKNTDTNITISLGTIFATGLVFLLGALVWYLRDVVLVVITAVVLASAIEPGARFFEKHRIPRALGVFSIYIGIALILGVLFYVFFPILLSDISGLINNLPEYASSLSVWNPLGEFETINNFFSFKQMIELVNSGLANITAGFFTTVSGLFGGIVSFGLIVVLSFYLAVQKDGVGDFLRIIIPVKYESYFVGLWRRSREKIGLWMQGQLLLAVIVGVLTYLGLTILGVKSALFLAFIAGVTELIPVFGIIIALIPAVAMAVLQEGPTLGFFVLGLYLIIQQFESHLIYPLVVKKVIGIPPILTILALVVGAKLAGFLGIILSVPLAGILVEVLSDVEKKKHPIVDQKKEV
jgi:predicted PurR-regulated permease PerM